MAVAYVVEAVPLGPNAAADAPVALLVLPNTPLSELLLNLGPIAI